MFLDYLILSVPTFFKKQVTTLARMPAAMGTQNDRVPGSLNYFHAGFQKQQMTSLQSVL
jgi:hypothetical protein